MSSAPSSSRALVLTLTACAGLIGGFYIQDIAIQRYRQDRDAKIRAIVDEEERIQEMERNANNGTTATHAR